MPTNINEYFIQIAEIWRAFNNEQISASVREAHLSAYRKILPSLQPSVR